MVPSGQTRGGLQTRRVSPQVGWTARQPSDSQRVTSLPAPQRRQLTPLPARQNVLNTMSSTAPLRSGVGGYSSRPLPLRSSALQATTPSRMGRGLRLPAGGQPGRSLPSLGGLTSIGFNTQSLSRPVSNNNVEAERIVFLDVDGVLHPYHARKSKLFRKDCMLRLKKIIEATEAAIVLSTSWRRTPQGQAAVNEQLRKHAIPAAIGITRIRHNEYLRHEEILHWISQHPSTSHWVALDDLPMPQLREHYIQTNPDVGLTDSNVQQAIQVLSQ